MELFRTSIATYVVDLTPRTWASAKANAESISVSLANKSTGRASLAIIDSAEEQAALAPQVLSLAKASTSSAQDGGGARYIWLGGSDVAVEGKWVWVNGTPLVYANWGTGSMWEGSGQSREPDNYSNQDALAMGLQTWPAGSPSNNGLGNAGQWNDIQDSNAMPSLIELPAQATRVQLGSRHVALDVDGNAGKVARVISAVFGKEALSNKQYVGIGLNMLDTNTSYVDLCSLAVQVAGLTTPDAAVTKLWTNVVGSAPSTNDKAPFIQMLSSGTTVGQLAKLAADTELNALQINLVGLQLNGVEYTPVN